MTNEWLTVLIAGPTWLVVAAMFFVMWIEHRSRRQVGVATAAGVLLAVWAGVATTMADRGAFVQPDSHTTPPIGINLVVVFALMTIALIGSPTLRSLLSNQRNLIRLNVWRLLGVIFLLLMLNGQMPALWALPAGIGDIIIGATAWSVARKLDSPGGRRRAIVFNLSGLLDLVIAVGLGVTTNPGPAQLFHTVPTSALVTHFPLALVPTFLVPLAFMIHVVSLWQLLGGSWALNSASDHQAICNCEKQPTLQTV